jgi:hypothetical protein
MRRQNPFLSIFGLLGTAALLLGLGLALWFRGGLAFNPGRLSAKDKGDLRVGGFVSHAEFESQCSRCHKPLESTQDQLCMDCHEDLAAQIKVNNGTHGIIQGVNRCFDCHLEHRGRDFDITRAAFTKFDHSQTRFSLVWHQVTYEAAPMDCSACHETQTGFKASPSNCVLCHADEDLAFIVQHTQDFGQNCTSCHDGLDRMVGFDHQATGFPLQGRHAQTSCADCHGVAQRLGPQRGGSPSFEDPFANTPRDCIGCHQEPALHQGLFTPQCAECHTTTGWTPARVDGFQFNHAVQAGFSLQRHRKRFDGQPITCNDCHPGDVHSLDVQTCVDCHSQGQENAEFMQQHQEAFGQDCQQCHDGQDRMRDFNHADFFPLEGRHAVIACESCHVDQAFAGTPTACVQCHAEPDIHAGFFGLDCQNCHSTEVWAPAQLKIHSFPLDHGGQGEIACQVCHLERYVQYACYGCHEHQPEAIAESHAQAGITPQELPDCAGCHPNDLKDESSP